MLFWREGRLGVPVRARLLYGGEGVFLTSGLYWTHLLCWIPFRVAPFSLDAPAVWGGSAWSPSKGATALWGSRILFPLGVPAAPGAPPSLSPWACLLRRNPLRVPPSPRARLLHGSASCVCCAASAVVGLPMTPCGVSHALFGLVFAYVFSEIALFCCCPRPRVLFSVLASVRVPVLPALVWRRCDVSRETLRSLRETHGECFT